MSKLYCEYYNRIAVFLNSRTSYTTFTNNTVNEYKSTGFYNSINNKSFQKSFSKSKIKLNLAKVYQNYILIDKIH